MRRRATLLTAAVGVAAALAATGLVNSGANAATTLTAASASRPASGHAAAAVPLPVSYNFLASAVINVNPNTPPPGADDWSCKPSSAHPYPVVLVHGTFANQDDDWQTASPTLKNAGYCVYSFNYGGHNPGDIIQGVGDIAVSAQQLSAFVDKVLAATGAPKVDLVGHSQGGMMPRQYLRFDGGSAVVHAFVALAPSNYGTTLGGITTLGDLLHVTGAVNSVLGRPGVCPACVEQQQGSAFLAALNAGGDTVPGVDYTVIESTHDEVVTPYTSAFLHDAGPAVTNITLDQGCSQDQAEHLEIAADPRAMAFMLNALDPAHPVAVPCLAVRPLVGP